MSWHGGFTSINGHGQPQLARLRRADFVAKVRFALLIKNSAGCRRGFRVKM
jgi:hypothetical protein